MNEGPEKRVGDDQPFEKIIGWVAKRRSALLARGVTPERILMGVDLFLLCQEMFRGQHLIDNVKQGTPLTDRFYGLDMICDPFLRPMEMRVLGSNTDNSLRERIVREANTE